MTIRLARVTALLTSLLLGGTLLAGCGDSVGTGDKGYVGVDGKAVITRLPVDERKKPGPVSGTTLEGEKLNLSQYDGKVVVLNVWGSWCPPCRAEAKDLAEAARELAAEDVVFLGINTKDSSPQQGLSFQKRYDVPYPSLFDPAGRTLLAFHGTLSPGAIPSTVILDARGRVAATVLGEMPSQRTLVDMVHDVSAGGTP